MQGTGKHRTGTRTLPQTPATCTHEAAPLAVSFSQSLLAFLVAFFPVVVIVSLCFRLRLYLPTDRVPAIAETWPTVPCEAAAGPERTMSSNWVRERQRTAVASPRDEDASQDVCRPEERLGVPPPPPGPQWASDVPCSTVLCISHPQLWVRLCGIHNGRTARGHHSGGGQSARVDGPRPRARTPPARQPAR